MANIPGISGYIQPGAFSRDRVISRGVSIPGGLRIVAILGEGLREETIVQSAQGSGKDGSASCSPTGTGDGRYFRLQNYPVVSGRTELRLNDTLLFGYEGVIDELNFDSKYDFRLDPSTGCIELQAASLADQNGKRYSASSLNIGNGSIVDETCGVYTTLDILDQNTPAERWTFRCVGVVRDENGDPVPGSATFSATGSVSGQIYDSFGNPQLFHSSYYSSTVGAISANLDNCNDGLVVADSVDWGNGVVTYANKFVISGNNLVEQGQVVPGDTLCIAGDSFEVASVEYDGYLDESTVTTTTRDLVAGTYATWDIRATNLLVDDPTIAHDPITGEVVGSAGAFRSSDVGKIIMICSGNAAGRYVISAVTSSRRVRLHQYGDAAVGFPSAAIDLATYNSEYAEDGIEFKVLEQNGILLIGIEEGSTPFEVNDRFFVDISSRALSRGDRLEAKYIFEGDVNDPEFFTSAVDLATKHGTPSETNTLSLGAQMAFENGAAGVLALQCKPSVARRTIETLLAEKNSKGVGGFSGCTTNCSYDDLMFTIPVPTTGLRAGRPDADSRVNIFIVRNGTETQIFPNKFDFYSSQLTTETQLNNWIQDPENNYSYTIVNTPGDVLGVGITGTIGEDAGGVYFTTPEFDFNASNASNGDKIMIVSMEDALGTTYIETNDISDELFGVVVPTEDTVTITSIATDNKVYITAANPFTFSGEFVNIQFNVISATSSGTDAALLLHKTLATSGALQKGDGIKISYVDQNDATFFDTNWFEALEKLEAVEAQIVVPLPTQTMSSVFRATVNHCENMSTIANRKERVAFIGAMKGLTTGALIGTEQVAIEDIGVLEGIQGDDPQEVLDGNVEDLSNYKLSDNYDSNRCVYFYPDSIVRNVAGSNVALHGFYMAAAAAGYISAKQNVAIPLTYKTLSGFSLTRDKIYRQTILNSLGDVGATVIQPVSGGGQVLAGRTTSQSGYVEDEEISIIFIRDAVKRTLRNSLKGYIGGVQSVDTNNLIAARVNSIMSSLITQGLITEYGNIRVEQDKVDPRQINVFLRFVPSYPINFIFVDIEVGIA